MWFVLSHALEIHLTHVMLDILTFYTTPPFLSNTGFKIKQKFLA